MMEESTEKTAKSGVLVQYCPSCAEMQRHRLAFVGEEVFAACHVCHAVFVMEDVDTEWAAGRDGSGY